MSPDLDRRSLLRAMATAPLFVGATRLMAAAPGTPKVLLVFLRGAYDAASLLVPFGSSFYYEQRPNIALPPPGTPGAVAALPLDADWALAPVMADTVRPLFERGQVAFVPFAGTDDASRSHFETQDSIELGQPSTGPRDYQSGFMNRLAQVLGSRDAIAFTDQLPLTFRGQAQVPNLALRSVGRPGLDARQSELIAAMYRGTPLAAPVNDGFAVRDEAVRELGARPPAMAGTSSAGLAGEMLAASRNAITASGFEGEARRIARLMRERYQLGFVDIGGWDTHVGQGAGTGLLANRLGELGKGLAAYADEMGATAWRDTTVVVISEFGRTFKENGSRGTDHGHGTVYWVLGGSVRGGRVAGEQVAVAPEMLFQNRDYPVLNEYRSLLAGLFGRLYGLGDARLRQVFAGVVAKDIGLV